VNVLLFMGSRIMQNGMIWNQRFLNLWCQTLKYFNLLVRIKILHLFLYTGTFVYLNKNWKIDWSEQSFTGLGSEDRTKFDWSWVRGQNKVLLVLGQRTEQSFTGLRSENRTKFYWSWVRGQNKVLLVLGQRTEQSFTRPVKLCSVLWPKTSKTLFCSLTQDQ
jgi:hypothetical protein